MSFTLTNFPGLIIFDPLIINDGRGYFYESYNRKVFEKAGININFVQDNQSSSSYGVIRGLHYQANPFARQNSSGY